ncbi:hypothetical protein BDAP_001618 [Binucleata daphniae]
MDRYITSENLNGKAPTFSDKATPDLFEIDSNISKGNDGMIRVLTMKYGDKHNLEKQFPETPLTSEPTKYGVMVMDVTPYKNTVIYFPYYDGINQYIKLEKGDSENKYKMVHRDKCIGYNENIYIFELVNCDDPILVQWFKLEIPFDHNKKKEKAVDTKSQ